MNKRNDESENMTTIIKIVENNLCTGCGTCSALCPSSAIKLLRSNSNGIYIPTVNKKVCNTCGICWSVCPGKYVNFDQLGQAFLSKNSKSDILLGRYLSCYLGFATDYNVRYNSSSGGVITTLLTFALREGLIDGALVTRMKQDNPLEPFSFIARTTQEILEAAKSKYCPVPVNMALAEILKNQEGKYAVVGLPCHLHGIRKAEMKNRSLRERILIHLGIFCSNVPTLLATKFIFWKLGINSKNVAQIDYRGKGWPGGMTIKLKDGTEKFIPKHDIWSSGFGTYFSTSRCKLCVDHTSEFADISFGDAWLPELKSDNIGWSMLVSRTDIGDRLLHSLELNGKIKLLEVDASKVRQSQGSLLIYKKTHLKARSLLAAGYPKPKYKTQLLNPKLNHYLRTIELSFGMLLASRKSLWVLLCIYISLLKFIGYSKKLIRSHLAQTM